ncbi:hypothetical protein BDR05DRAFT_952150 [Suillus weaverae]|nr:hypothetical protein BDR05DRAFT_952150 [Suillus weaverae]
MLLLLTPCLITRIIALLLVLLLLTLHLITCIIAPLLTLLLLTPRLITHILAPLLTVILYSSHSGAFGCGSHMFEPRQHSLMWGQWMVVLVLTYLWVYPSRICTRRDLYPYPSPTHTHLLILYPSATAINSTPAASTSVDTTAANCKENGGKL